MSRKFRPLPESPEEEVTAPEQVFGGVVSPQPIIDQSDADNSATVGDEPVDPAAAQIGLHRAIVDAMVNPGPWPNAERLSRAERHMAELLNALPEAIEAANGGLKRGLVSLREFLS